VDATRLAAGTSGTHSSTPDRSGRARDSRPTSSGWLSSSAGIDHGRFEPGTLLGGRYRIIGRLGRGGMGEVYRADDLKLGQAVALKFLPPEVDRDPARLTQLHTEVRMARQVSHPNVCRVYDIDELDGTTFLSMEFVDGEDLSSLLKRVGRFPEDRGLEIARQICAGLAAAHERQVVHRDLKPANVMLDSAGKVRITDFGLAGVSGESLRAGTPAYMAPEQIAGGEVSPRSDVYSLGLVLYEIFTGQRALEGKNLAELIHKREHSGIVPPTTIVKALDPKIELAVMRCLKPAIADRPASALAVAAALPGGDPLAAALAAGETPSPEMVAAAGNTDALHPAIGLGLLSLVVVAVLANAALAERYLLYARVPMQKSLDSLADRARDILATIGYSGTPTDTARGLSIDFDAVNQIARTSTAASRWDELNKRVAPVMLFWHRSSPQLLVPFGSSARPTAYDPPTTLPGMTRMTLDDTGRLVEFEGVPPWREQPSATPAPAPWPKLFSAAGLEIERFRSVEPTWVPREYATERAAWEGPLPTAPAQTLRVEAAAHRGVPVFFKTIGPWAPVQPATVSAGTPPRTFWRALSDVMGTAVIFGALLLARVNWKAGRGDRRGAGRLFALEMAVLTVAWIIGARHYASFPIEMNTLYTFVAFSLLTTGRAWVLYIALEPYVRRYSPGILISWTRVLTGQIVDPRVGRDVLVGVAVGAAVALLSMGYLMVPRLLGQPLAQPRATNLQMLLDAPIAIATVLRMIPNNIQNGMYIAVAFGFGLALSGRRWGGVVFAALLLSIFVMADVSLLYPWVGVLFLAAFVVPLVATLIYSGLLAVVIAFLTNQALSNAPLTLDPSMPYASGALWSLLLVFGLATFGFYTSRAGHSLLGRLAEERLSGAV